jgi:HEAT repeat protein
MHRLDPDKTHELVEQALESGSPDMKVAAIACLEGKPESLSYLLEQSKSKSSDVRRAALSALASFIDDDVVNSLIKALSGGDVALAAGPASRNRSPKLLEFLLADARQQFAELPKIKEKTKAGKALARFYHFLGSFATRDDRQTIDFLTACFEKRELIGKLKGEIEGDQVNRRVASLLVRSNVPAALKLVADSHASLSPDVLDWAIVAAVRTRSPKEVYDLFSPYYLVKPGAKKKRDDAAFEKRESVREILSALGAGWRRRSKRATASWCRRWLVPGTRGPASSSRGPAASCSARSPATTTSWPTCWKPCSASNTPAPWIITWRRCTRPPAASANRGSTTRTGWPG